MSKLFNWAAARLVAAFALALPLAAMATTSTYSTYKDDTDTPGAGGAYTTGQAFQLNATWMFNTSGDDIANASAAVKVDSIAVKWASSTHGNADIGHNRSGEQPNAYLVVTTPQDVIVGVSGVNDTKWVANGTSTFAFTDLVLASDAQYIYYFATDVSGLAVGQLLAASTKKNGRILGAWHGSAHTADSVVHINGNSQYSINSIFTVSDATVTALTTSSEAVNLSNGSDPVFVTGAVAAGVVNVASGVAVPSLTVVGQATTFKLADSLSATYLYLPATTTIDASDVTFAMPSGDATTAETVLVSGKISSSSNPTVTLPALAEGYAFEPVVYDDTGIKVTVSKPVDATVTLVNGTELLWSNVKPEGWINSAVPTITINNTSNAGTLVFDENVQAAKIVLPGGWAANIKRSAGVTVDIPYFSCPNNYANHTFTDFEAIPQTVQTTTSADKIYVSGTETLTSFPQISTANQCADISIAQKATFADNGFNVVGSKTINIGTGADISAARFVLGNNGGVTQTVNQNGGTVTVTGSAAPTSNQASILLGHWGSGTTATLKTLGGTFTANNVASRLGWDGTATWQIGGGSSDARVNVYGIVNGGNGHAGTGTLNIMANGTLNLGAGGIDFSNSSNGGNINLAGGTIDTGASAVTITNAKDGGTIINQGTTTAINVGSGETLTVNAVLSGSGVGTLNKTGEGKMILAKTATTKGKLLVSAGTVEFNEGINWGSNGTVEIGQNGTLNVLTTESVAEGELLVAGAFTVSGTVLNNGTAVDVDVKPTGIYIAMSSVTITVPAVEHTTVAVTADGNAVGPTEPGASTYVVDYGAAVVVTYTADDADAYEVAGGTIEFAATQSTEVTAPTVTPYVAWIYDGNNEIIGKYKQPLPAVIAFGSGTGEKARFAEALDETYHNMLITGCSYDAETITYTRLPTVAVIISASGVWTNKYPTIAAAVSDATVGDTITLVDDVALAESVEVAAGKSITIDLNGKTITGPAGGYAFSNAGEITIENGAVTGAGGVAENTADGASIAVSSGSYTTSSDLFGNVEGGTIEVSGGTFNKSVADEYLAEGFEVNDNGDGTYGVRDYLGWIYSGPGKWNYTGTWSEGATLGVDKVTIETNATYTASKDSAGDIVTLAMTVNFDEANNDVVDISDVKGAVRIGKDDNESYVFQFATWDGTEAVWTNADATAAVDVAINTNYTLLLVFDLTTKSYTTSVIDGTATNALTVAGSTAIAFANQGEASPIRSIDFVGSGSVTSIEGSYENAPAPAEEFVNGEEIGSVSLDTAQAAWLNGQNNYAALVDKIKTMSQDAFNKAYLLNLDITDPAYDGTFRFTVTEFTVGDSDVTVKVELTRNGKLAGGINGTLKLTGTADLDTDFADISVIPVGDDDFSDGDTATWTFDKGSEKFFQPVIE